MNLTRRDLVRLGAGWALAAAWPVRAAAAAAADQLDNLFLPADIDRPCLAPDGEHVAVVARTGDVTAVGVFDLKTGRQQVVFRPKKGPVVGVWWKTPRRLLVCAWNLVEDRKEYHGVDFDGGNVQDLWRLNEHGDLLDVLLRDPERVLMRSRGSVLRVALGTGTVEVVEQNLNGVQWWVTDQDGQVRAAWGSSGVSPIAWWRPPGDLRWRSHVSPDTVPEFLPLGFERDGRHLVALDAREGDTMAVVRFDTVTERREVLMHRPDVDPTHAISVPGPRRTMYVRYGQLPSARAVALDAADAPHLARLQAQFPQYLFTVIDALPDNRRWLVQLESSRTPGMFVLFEPPSGKVTLLAHAAGNRLPEATLAAADHFSVRTQDGRILSGLLWRPAGAAKAPLVVLVAQGVPAEPALNRFDPMVQALVAGGFAVARVNARGTAGFGRRHLDGGAADFAAALREDYGEAIAALAGKQAIDGRRVALAGFGMGGAVALHLATGGVPVQAVINVEGPLELGGRDLRIFSADRDATRLGVRVGGWAKVRAQAEGLAVLANVARCRVPALHLYDDAPENKGRLSESGQRVRKAAAAGGVPATVALARPWTDRIRLPLQRTREDAALAGRLIAFLREAMPAAD